VARGRSGCRDARAGSGPGEGLSVENPLRGLFTFKITGRRSRRPIGGDGTGDSSLALMSLDEFLDRYHRAADAFSRGDSAR
jgi:hypothetical protein